MDSEMLNQRIAQWEKMVAEAPDGMSYFSLGNAYKEADRDEEAARAFRKAIEHDNNLSRAYQSLAQLLIKADAKDQAAEVLTKGYVVASRHGDIMPKRAMGSLLEKIGVPIPELAPTEEEAAVELGDDAVLDRRTGQPGPRLPDQPLRGPLGKFIYDHYSQPTWQQWIGQGTKVINELRLDFSNLEHQHIYDLHMMEWLGFTQEEVDEYAKSQSSD